jgi:UDP-N-acetylmuramate--alanine ligase
MELDRLKRIHFLGIGGIGMSALARYFHRRGVQISGYDRTPSPLTKKLEEEGMRLHYTENVGAIPPDVDILIVTPAVPLDHAERTHALEMGIPIHKRAEILGLLSQRHRTIAIGGTHGKTTCSTMTAWLLKSGGEDCTAFLGGISTNFDSNYVHGESPWMVVEADEYDRSFFQLNPEWTAVLSIDPDHLDVYDEVDRLEEAYATFAGQTAANGKILLPLDVFHKWKDSYLPLLREKGQHIESFGIDGGTVQARAVGVVAGQFEFEYIADGESHGRMQLPLPGRHNVLNALVAIRMAQYMGIAVPVIKEKLALFKGIRRRFEWIYQSDMRVLIDDYAHHPTELAAAIGAARELFPGRHLTGIFQPHLYSRTRDFADDFAEQLSKLDQVVLLEIYPAREKPIPGIDSGWLLDKIEHDRKVLLSKEELVSWLGDRKPDVVMTLGAGDIDRLVPAIKKRFEDDEKR